MAELTVKLRQFELSKLTLVAPVKLVPVIVKVSPPRKWPEFGEIDVTVGFNSSYVTLTLPLVPYGVLVTTACVVPAPLAGVTQVLFVADE